MSSYLVVHSSRGPPLSEGRKSLVLNGPGSPEGEGSQRLSSLSVSGRATLVTSSSCVFHVPGLTLAATRVLLSTACRRSWAVGDAASVSRISLRQLLTTRSDLRLSFTADAARQEYSKVPGPRKHGGGVVSPDINDPTWRRRRILSPTGPVHSRRRTAAQNRLVESHCSEMQVTQPGHTDMPDFERR